jgi:hypothetical protein
MGKSQRGPAVRDLDEGQIDEPLAALEEARACTSTSSSLLRRPLHGTCGKAYSSSKLSKFSGTTSAFRLGP